MERPLQATTGRCAALCCAALRALPATAAGAAACLSPFWRHVLLRCSRLLPSLPACPPCRPPPGYQQYGQPQQVYVQQQPHSSGPGADACCAACLAALCFCCCVDMLT